MGLGTTTMEDRESPRTPRNCMDTVSKGYRRGMGRKGLTKATSTITSEKHTERRTDAAPQQTTERGGETKLPWWLADY